MLKQEAFLAKTPAKGAPLQRGRRRRRSGLPGEFTPTAGSGRRAEAASQSTEARPPLPDPVWLLNLFTFYDGRVPGFELSAEGFHVPRLEAEGFILRTRNPLHFGCYLIGPALEKFANDRPARNRPGWNFENESSFNIKQREKHENKP